MLKAILSFFSVTPYPDPEAYLHFQPEPGMLFKGAEKPTTTLAYMIAAEILKMDPFKPKGGEFIVKGVRVIVDKKPVATVRFEGKEYPYKAAEQCMRDCSADNGKYSGYYTVGDIHSYSVPEKYFRKNIHKYLNKFPTDPPVKVVGDVFFDERELLIISEAVKKAEALQVERDKLAAIEKNQQKAVDIIAEWMGVPEKIEESDGDGEPFWR